MLCPCMHSNQSRESVGEENRNKILIEHLHIMSETIVVQGVQCALYIIHACKDDIVCIALLLTPHKYMQGVQ